MPRQAPTRPLSSALDRNTRDYWRVRAGIRPAPEQEPDWTSWTAAARFTTGT